MVLDVFASRFERFSYFDNSMIRIKEIKKVRVFLSMIVLAGVVVLTSNISCQENPPPKSIAKKTNDTVSFKKDVFPIIKRNCLPCHAEDNFNPSELSLDDYRGMSAGGKNGALWSVGNSEESLVIKKLDDPPPFGERMPLNSKRKIKEGKAKYLTSEEIKVIASWIDAGALDN